MAYLEVAYDKATQTASPAYYKVKLTDSDIDVEVTSDTAYPPLLCNVLSNSRCARTNVAGYAKV